MDSSIQKQLLKTSQASIKAINSYIEKVEKQIKELIQKDAHLKDLFDFITFITGVGTVTASDVIVATKEFNSISDPKNAGVAPFPYLSGSSVRGKTGVRVYQICRK